MALTQDTTPAGPSGGWGQARALLALGVPLALSHVAQILISTTDMVMVGWYDVTALAAMSIGWPFFIVLFVLGSGFAWAVMPLVAAAAGTDDDRQVRRVTRMGIWLSIAFSGAALVPFLLAGPILRALGQPEEVAELAARYLHIAGFAMLPSLIVVVLKSYLSALEFARVQLIVVLGAAALNAGVNWLLIFGHFGAPEMGIRGAAVATVVVNIAAAAALSLYAVWKTPQYTLFVRFARPDWEAMGRVFQLGWPISMTSISEVAIFGGASVMMGWIGEVALAANGIALQIATVTFMFQLGLSQAVTVKVGQAWGRGDRDEVRRVARVALIVSMIFVLPTILAFTLFPEALIGAFLDPGEEKRAAIVALGSVLLIYAALFQVFDALQVMALGMLRGVQDTRVPMWIAALSYWVVGFGAALGFGFGLGMGAPGIWIGLVLCLVVAAGLMTARFWRRV